LFLTQQFAVDHGLLIHVVSRSHTTTHHSRKDSSGRVISSSHRPLPGNTQQSQQTSMTPLGFEPTISAGERPQAYALNRADTGTKIRKVYHHKKNSFSFLSRTFSKRFNRNTAHVPAAVQFYPFPAKKALILLLFGSDYPDIQGFSTSWQWRHKLHLSRAPRIKSNWNNSCDLNSHVTTIIFKDYDYFTNSHAPRSKWLI
jgi:hypothetical protein